jgi:hypothetical protein
MARCWSSFRRSGCFAATKEGVRRLQENQMIVNTMQQEISAPEVGAGFSGWQRRAGSVGMAGRKVVLASVGFFAYVVDGAAVVVKSGTRLFTSAEHRGVRMSRDVTRRFGDLEEQAVAEMRKLQEDVDENVDHLRVGILNSKGSTDEELEKRVELVLNNLGLPSRERIERLGQEIDDLNQKIDQQLMRLPDKPYPEPLG